MTNEFLVLFFFDRPILRTSRRRAHAYVKRQLLIERVNVTVYHMTALPVKLTNTS